MDGKAGDLDVQAEIIHTNRENDRTTEQHGREFIELKRIESERAALRQKQAPIKARAAKKGEVEVVPVNSSEHVGEAAEIAADIVGMSRQTAERAAEVVEKIDELEDAGKSDEANELRETLESSVSAAHREVADVEVREVKDSAGNVLPKRIQKPFELVSDFRGIINKIGAIVTKSEEMMKERGGEGLPISAIRTTGKDFQSCFSAAMPYALCPYCKGHKCTKCKDRGWITQDGWNGIPKAKREEMLK